MCEVIFELGPLLELNDYGGDWDTYIEAIYEVFRQDLLLSKPTFDGRPVYVRKQPFTKGKENTFWHLVQEGTVEEERTPNLFRCARIGWIRKIIEQGQSNSVITWRNTRPTSRGPEARLVISLPDFSYLVVLGDRANYWLLCSAYPVEREHSRKKLKREFEEYNRTLSS